MAASALRADSTLSPTLLICATVIVWDKNPKYIYLGLTVTTF